ncbi:MULTISPECIES: 6-phosphogluconolactonase [unclassified Pseudomonas]|uniref:6-phosphogluconolactonase n=1 Tax=unclassified Pseudomonas TaxID=196821 RepID=UPI000BCD9E38|nr:MULTISPECIES: 6-phosphogluconolactonase [unclassified Pseudomonas]PVZ11223.1 6-phosphogluconolactonase [Pseudomonas sp. URIL14HWK12:I12]PVZ22221.1 6-phosphogluconolactonase [Pseudomonas sp. URIL14HWK12:I10]PVZ31655.1 6-phosphogluconolactonase [Pseudomonas sp. URIL14HWK12:I11]SNZ16717.1 6-phosphogluconolactonase [Pseudomonas sp. URIL14HWK12:I9]
MAISELKLPKHLAAHEFTSPPLLAESLAERVVERLRDGIEARGHAALVVSGGRSPVMFFQALARLVLDWSKVTITLADERWVPVTHADSNEGLVKRYLLQGPVAKAHFIGLYRATDSQEESAAQADHALAELGEIDVLVLGMGDDGHTASLFPASPGLAEALAEDNPRRCVPMLAPSVPHQRLSMTRSLLAGARYPILSIQGQGKLDTLRTALAGDDLAQMPVRAFLNAPLDIFWCP